MSANTRQKCDHDATSEAGSPQTRRLLGRIETLEAEVRRLRDVASRDPLTGLHNRSQLKGRLEEALDAGCRRGIPTSCVLLDLDGFKAVNDRVGHLAGDALLRAVASALDQSCRVGDFLCRFGGDEFAVVLPGTDAEQTGTIVRRLLAAVATCSVQGGSARATAGWATVGPQHAQDAAHELLRAADQRLLEGKRAQHPRRTSGGPTDPGTSLFEPGECDAGQD